ncbi:MAG: beta-lactamase family protein [Verrucomicrobia bacterium]|nr:beta-lactamase family protein [Verrucomicrobiota bacterium]
MFLGAGLPAYAAVLDQFDSAKLAQMETEISRAIVDRKLPGGVLWIERNRCHYVKAFGLRASVPKSEPMTEDTIFDVASITKVLATVPALMILYERGQLKLDDPVARHLPEFKRGSITIRHLLTHTSGFTRTLSGFPDWGDFKAAFKLICAERPENPPGAAFLYSDINFIILGELVQRVAGMKLNDFVAREIFGPLKMHDTSYRPPESKRSRIAPTERAGREVLRGKVHDPKAQRMGGVAGHAGVFSTASDVARFARMLLNEGELDGVRILRPETVKLMTTVQTPASMKTRRGLGWDIDSEFSRPRGKLFPVGSYGHTGFTGVCLWIDPFSKTFWMLLSNRVHPEPSGNIYALQRALGTMSAEAVKNFDFRGASALQ